MAASRMPNTRISTRCAVTPRTARHLVREQQDASVAAMTDGERRDGHRQSRPHRRRALAASRMPALMAPGPASSGVASGNTARSSLVCASAPSGGVSLKALVGRANTISSAIMSRMIPPAVCSAGMDTPSCAEQRPARERRDGEDAGRDQRRPDRDQPALGCSHDRRQRREQHRSLDRADRGEEGREAGERGRKHERTVRVLQMPSIPRRPHARLAMHAPDVMLATRNTCCYTIDITKDILLVLTKSRISLSCMGLR